MFACITLHTQGERSGKKLNLPSHLNKGTGVDSIWIINLTLTTVMGFIYQFSNEMILVEEASGLHKDKPDHTFCHRFNLGKAHLNL